MDQHNNPLKQYFRQPNRYVKLPSDGRFYPEGTIDFPENHEVAIYPMTARDEMLLKTPDALLNGQAVIEIIKSCVPSIKQPWSMPAADLDACLIAIRMATYGDEYELDTVCPNCNESWRFMVDLRTFLDQAHNFHWEEYFEFNGLKFKLWPLNYAQVTKNQMKVLEEQRTFQFINDAEIAESEKMQLFTESFRKLAELNMTLVSTGVAEITTPDGFVAADPELIEEFFNNCDRATFTAVRERLEHLRGEQNSLIRPIKLKCNHCEHDYEKTMAFDESFFFAPNS